MNVTISDKRDEMNCDVDYRQRAEPAVRVLVSERDGAIEVVISDDGPSFTDDQRVKALGRLWPSGEQSNRRLGSGLGLAIVAQKAQSTT